MNEKAGSKRGFAAMSPEEQQRISSLGGKAAHANGCLPQQWTSEQARAAGRKGGAVTSANREHMSAIARKGVEARRLRSAKAIAARIAKDAPEGPCRPSIEASAEVVEIIGSEQESGVTDE